MAVYYCNRCDRYVDDDYTPCVEDPESPKGQFWVMCCEHEDDEDALTAPTGKEGK
jgi:hypothetical protein